MNGPVRVGFLCSHNPYDRSSFSGVPYYMLRALKSHPQIDVSVIGDYHPLASGLVGRLARKLAKPKAMDWNRVPIPAGLDFVIGLVSSGIIAAQASRLTAPVFHVTDATPGFLRKSYGLSLGPEADATERACLEASSAAMYSSRYMAECALKEFPELVQDRVSAFPFGLNLDDTPDAVPAKPPLSTLNMLFIGGDWERKGGRLAVEVLDRLRARDVDATLTVMGNRDAERLDHPHLRVLGFVDKNTRAGQECFVRELSRAHLLLHPTRADCSAMVVAEANAFGCPVLVTDVGGIGSVMAPGHNGEMFGLEEGPEAIADRIMALTGDPLIFEALSQSSRKHFEDNLTWDVWVDRMLAFARHVKALGPGRAISG